MSYLLHIHSSSTSSIDKYWIFNNYQNAKEFYIQCINFQSNYINFEYYKEIYENENEKLSEEEFKNLIKTKILNNDNITVYLEDGDYIIFTTINNGFASR